MNAVTLSPGQEPALSLQHVFRRWVIDYNVKFTPLSKVEHAR